MSTKNTQNSVFLTDSGSIATLAIARSLSKRGINITCGDEYRFNPTFYSKYVTNRVLYPSPYEKYALCTKTMLGLSRKNNYSMIIPMSDQMALLLSKNKNVLSRFSKIPIIDYKTLLNVYDKGRLIKKAREINIPYPPTYFPEEINLSEIRREAKYPLLIKPRKSTGGRGIRYINSPSELFPNYFEVKKKFGEPIIQEYIPHDMGIYSVNVLMNHFSEPIAIHAQKEYRRYPLGSATFAESIRDKKLINYAITLLKALKWEGVCQVEFIMNPEDKEFLLLEVNMRFWMSLPLAIASGVDFPYLLYNVTMNRNVERVFKYKIGIKYRWLFPADLLWLVKSKINTTRKMREFIKSGITNMTYGVISKTDPKPIAGIILKSLSLIKNHEKRALIIDRDWKPSDF